MHLNCTARQEKFGKIHGVGTVNLITNIVNKFGSFESSELVTDYVSDRTSIHYAVRRDCRGNNRWSLNWNRICVTTNAWVKKLRSECVMYCLLIVVRKNKKIIKINVNECNSQMWSVRRNLVCLKTLWFVFILFYFVSSNFINHW